MVKKVITIPATKARELVVSGCHDCPFRYYQGGMSDSSGYFCGKLKSTNPWGFMVNREVERKIFPKECPL